MCYHCILFLAFLLSSHHLSNLLFFTGPTCMSFVAGMEAVIMPSPHPQQKKEFSFENWGCVCSGGGMVTLQGWFCTSCWWATRPFGTRTSTASTPRSRQGRMTTPPRSGTLSLLRWQPFAIGNPSMGCSTYSWRNNLWDPLTSDLHLH